MNLRRAWSSPQLHLGKEHSVKRLSTDQRNCSGEDLGETRISLPTKAAPGIMPVFMNPFHKHDVSEFPDTFVPLAHAERHPSIVAAHKDMDKKNLPSASPVNDAGDTSDNGYSAYTIEGLISEIDSGMLSTIRSYGFSIILENRYCSLSA